MCVYICIYEDNTHYYSVVCSFFNLCILSVYLPLLKDQTCTLVCKWVNICISGGYYPLY